MFLLNRTISCYCDTVTTGIEIAFENLKRDLKTIGGASTQSADKTTAELIIDIDKTIEGDEQYVVKITADKITIAGSDELGVIFGVYKLSEIALGVDPLWFWKDDYPEHNSIDELEEMVVSSSRYTFRYRGWFVNDEDLLTEWMTPSGKRHIDYPYYENVPALEVMEAVFEAALRSGVNMIIPATFVDIMNPPERKLVEMAVERGLYVSQHHVEPLGVSHFTFEEYWKARGENCDFSYSANRDKVVATWKTYVERWYKLAGDKVVWQVGLRGRGDSSAWYSDSGITRETAGRFISDALADQVELIKSIDERDEPPMTITLWLEMSELMAEKKLVIPDSVIRVFCDDAKRHALRDDFYTIEREAGHCYGTYLHAPYWINGPHAIPGVHPERLRNNFGEVALKGDTEYAIISVCNIREHAIDIQAADEMMVNLETWRLSDFMDKFAGEFVDEYYRYFEAFCQTSEGVIQDGQLWLLVKQINQQIRRRDFNLKGCLENFDLDTIEKRRSFIMLLEGKINILRSVLVRRLEGMGTCHEIHLFYFSEWLLRIYQILIATLRSFDNMKSDEFTLTLLDDFLEFRAIAEQGKWKNWYRGDRKTDWRAIRDSLRNEDEEWLEWSA